MSSPYLDLPLRSYLTIRAIRLTLRLRRRRRDKDKQTLTSTARNPK